jgi:hypothetical protein
LTIEARRYEYPGEKAFEEPGERISRRNGRAGVRIRWALREQRRDSRTRFRGGGAIGDAVLHVIGAAPIGGLFVV